MTCGCGCGCALGRARRAEARHRGLLLLEICTLMFLQDQVHAVL